MRRALPRTRLGAFRSAWIALQIALLGLLVGSTGAIGHVRERWEASTESPQARGARLYQTMCFGCHGGVEGGLRADIPPKHNRNGHTWEHGDCELVAFARDGIAPAMPAFRGRLDPAEIDAVVAHIKTMWTDDQRTAQRATTATRCDGR